MLKQKKSKNQLEKQRDQSRQRNEEFFIKKDMERDLKDAMARQAEWEKLGKKLEKLGKARQKAREARKSSA